MNCPDHRIRNTSGEMLASKFIKLCFRVKDDYILHATALVVSDFGSVKFLLSISSMNQLNSMIDVSSRQISIRKKSFIFKSCFHNRIKAHDTLTIGIKIFCLRSSGTVISLLNCFIMLQTIYHKANTALGSVSFKLVRNLLQCTNTVTHLHEDLDGSIAMCSLKISYLPVNGE